MKRFIFAFTAFSLTSITAFSQNETVGLVNNSSESGVDFVLFNPEASTSSYLINRCGELVNQWTFSNQPGKTAYLLENGNILQSGSPNLEIRDWDNNLTWTFDVGTLGYTKHHDIEPLPNGNILLLIHDEYTPDEVIALGKDPSTVGATFKLDKIIEIEPLLGNAANVVWEWKFIDHLIQDFDAGKPNFGVVADHPELLDFNHAQSHATDFTHANGMDYNANLDQILISARHTNEIYIIDHSTTTVEAAIHSGGNNDKGGDLLWRFGNIATYGAGMESDQKLRLQHDAKWITSVNPEENNISVFNNGSDGTIGQSSVHKLSPQDSSGFYKMESGAFLPNDFSETWSGTINGTTVNEGKKSGVQVLSNGNFLLTETSIGRVSEVNLVDGTLWSYSVPVGNGFIYNQFDAMDQSTNSNDIFRGENYATDFPGFVGKDMSGNGIIENVNDNSSACILGVSEISESSKIEIINTLSNGTILLSKKFNGIAQVYNMNGQLVASEKVNSNNSFSIQIKQGLYIVQLIENKQSVLNTKIFIK
jgi:hypothetical protein